MFHAIYIIKAYILIKAVMILHISYIDSSADSSLYVNPPLKVSLTRICIYEFNNLITIVFAKNLCQKSVLKFKRLFNLKLF